MAIRHIIQTVRANGSLQDDNKLHTPSKQVVVMDDNIAHIITDLRDTMWAYPFCSGLSAPQIGESWAITVINFKHTNRLEDLILINPKIISQSGQKDKKRESCMSVWGFMAEVERRKKVIIQYQDEQMNSLQQEFQGFEARVILHEIDHLNGVVYTDYLSEESELLKSHVFDGY